ncbi:MAG: hypothetical protein ACK53X_02820 [Holosporales bacterium]
MSKSPDDPLQALKQQHEANKAYLANLAAAHDKAAAERRAKVQAIDKRDKIIRRGIVGVGGLTALGVVGVGIKAVADRLSQQPAEIARTVAPAAKAAKETVVSTLQAAIDWRKNNKGIPYFGNNISLDTLQRLQGAGGIEAAEKVLDGINVSAGTQEELIKLANAAGLDPSKHADMIQKYKDAYDAFKIDPNNHDVSYADEKAEALAGSLKAVEKYFKEHIVVRSIPTNPIAHLGEHIKQTFNNLINPDVRIASSNAGVVSDMGNGILPPQGVLSGLGQHLQHFAKTAQEAVGATARHASEAVSHAWNSEPVQGTLHLVKENSHYLAAGSAAVMLITPAVRAALEKQEKNSSPVPAATIQAKFQNALRVTKAVLTTKISVQDYAKQFNNPQTILAGVRTAGFALATVSPAAAVVATATTAAGVSSLAARVVHAATKDKQGFEKIAAASKYMGDMEYINAATKSVQQTMASVQHTMAGLFGRITQQFKTA